MLSDYISPGNRVELKATGKIWMDEDARTKHIYMSKVMDVTSDDRIEILMPFEKGKVVLLPVDGEYSLCFYSTRGLFQCYARIIDRYRSDNMYILVLDLISELQKLQRREYYRFSCALELKSRLCSKEELEAFERNRKYLVDADFGLQRSVVVDISGGGLRFVANFKYEEGSTIYCSYRLPGNANDKEYEMICTVLKVSELESRPGLYEHRIQYVYIDETSREDIIHFIFEEERKIRKKQT
ncbi:c-di-GMP-binding flagellar brake protein YcgR, contains PilZNR and PilZ domains [Butyrivibrio hungatei DSM 14810]|uniref:C-di-GMP-binding flagellar brake protein YcgR, contains PilZNR and PilZ domains n=1 Tax=Butyrivibrio hungatei DSM 14810 TaxID=1121132 RepID=A0A1M7SXU9_9FIRM|nr:flagellar brake protein [Butyrivibrio hungatei]SHN63290.1 c-di-GMP-binding flagellar brake protein YcgR, contains PilZNR and PilZ domains [Butyrivibrio hungatei DSM 14810]